jgi:hypothetical protein
MEPVIVIYAPSAVAVVIYSPAATAIQIAVEN